MDGQGGRGIASQVVQLVRTRLPETAGVSLALLRIFPIRRR